MQKHILIKTNYSDQARDRTHDFRVMLNYRRTEPYMTYQSKKEQIPEYV